MYFEREETGFSL
uniref:Uncharacterized protein n=1 Tax=Arundo donax TaxID=35708 RepID=A0A0A9C3F5_ARUDO